MWELILYIHPCFEFVHCPLGEIKTRANKTRSTLLWPALTQSILCYSVLKPIWCPWLYQLIWLKKIDFELHINNHNAILILTVTFAAAAIFSYWWLIPAAIYGVLWWRSSQAGYTFLEILCVYGYSLAIYIPISVSSTHSWRYCVSMDTH